jgi:hypothetical protein
VSSNTGNRPTLNFKEFGMDDLEYEMKNKVFLSPRLLGHTSGCSTCDVCKMKKKINDEILEKEKEKQSLEEVVYDVEQD